MFYFVGIAITFFLAFLLAIKKGKSPADKILATWLSCTGLHLLLYYFYFTKNYLSFPFLLGVEIPIPLLHGPFLFIYTAALTNPKFSIKRSLWHFVPFLIAVLFLIPFFGLSSAEKIAVYEAEGKGYEMLMGVVYVAILLSGVLYTCLSLISLVRHRNAITEQFSSTEKITLNWLFYLILGSAIIWLIVIFSGDTAIFSAVVLYMIFIGFFGINQVGIFTSQKHKSATSAVEHHLPVADAMLETSPQPEKAKYEKSQISAEEVKAIHQKLTDCMREEQLYKNPELKLSDLAQKMEVYPNALSQVINSVEQKNFYDYINLQRIEEFKRITALPENQKFTLLSLAFECGFNSKTSFNRNFKKVTDLSPTEFLKQANIHLQ